MAYHRFLRVPSSLESSRAIAARGRAISALDLRPVLVAVLLTASALALLRTTADYDLWGHVRFGNDIIASRSVPTADTYSFTQDRPWINHEWLAEVLMAAAYATAGTAGLNGLRLLVIAIVVGLVWASGRGANPMWRLLLVGLTSCGILLRVHPVRPQLFSVLLFTVMLVIITGFEQQRRRHTLAWLPLTFIAWANLHGGWIVGIAVLGLWILGQVVRREATRMDRWFLLAVGMASLAGTLVNPYGVDLWRFLAATVRLDRPMISDWQPTYLLPPAFAMLWLVPLLMTVAALRAARADRLHFLIVAVLAVSSLRVSRLDAFFALATVFLLGPQLMQCRIVTRWCARVDGTPSLTARRLAVVSACAVLTVSLWRPPLMVMPLDMPEVEAARYIACCRFQGRMLVWFDWGEYAIWHFGPHIRVSIDGRRETVYTDDVTNAHLRFYRGDPGYADRIGADFVWLPRGLPVVPLLRERGWREAFVGPVSVVLTRSSVATPIRSTTASTVRTFPSM